MRPKGRRMLQILLTEDDFWNSLCCCHAIEGFSVFEGLVAGVYMNLPVDGAPTMQAVLGLAMSKARPWGLGEG